jgi:hypothetical protein
MSLCHLTHVMPNMAQNIELCDNSPLTVQRVITNFAARFSASTRTPTSNEGRTFHR